VKHDKQDRRSQRTRRLVNSAFLELLSEKRYDAITVQDILDRAGIGRSTFYSHYVDKDDVHTSLIEDMLERMNQQLSKERGAHGVMPSLQLFQHIQDDHKHFRALTAGQTGERLWEAVQAALGKSIEQTLASDATADSPGPVPLPVVSSYLAGAFLNLLKWWVQSGMPYSPEEMDRMFRLLALPGVTAALDRTGDSAVQGHPAA